MSGAPIRLRAVVAAVAALLTLLVASPAHGAVKREKGVPYATPSGLLNISPGRIEEDVQPGVRKTLRITLTADSDEAFDVTVRPTDIGAATDPRSVAAQVEDGEFGAGDWLTPEVTDLRLEPFETVSFDVVVDPPSTAPVGTNLGGLVIDSTPAEGPIGTEDTDSVFRIEGLIQIFLTVPGPVQHDLRITDIDVRDTFVLGSQRFSVWDITFRNAGTVNEHVNGKARVRSIFGNAAHTLTIEELLVLRGAERTTRVVWRDLPWVGAFRLDVGVRGDDSRLVEQRSDWIFIMPWWLPVVIVLAFVLPALWLWWRRRQEWRMYLEDEDELGDHDWDDNGALTH